MSMRPLSPLLLALAACAGSPPEPTPAPTFELANPEPVVHRPARFAPDLVTQRSTRPTEPGVGQRASGGPSLRARLRETRMPSFQVRDEESLRAVVDRIQAFTGLPLVVAPTAENACFDDGVVFTFDLQNPIRVQDLLNLIEKEAADTIRWGIRHEAVIFTSADKALSAAKVMRMYDIRMLTFGRTDFSGPRIDRLRLLEDLEDDDGGGPFGGVGERFSQTTPEEVIDLIQEQVAPETWTEDGVSIDHSEGLLIVVNSVEVQARVNRFLQQLGAF